MWDRRGRGPNRSKTTSHFPGKPASSRTAVLTGVAERTRRTNWNRLGSCCRVIAEWPPHAVPAESIESPARCTSVPSPVKSGATSRTITGHGQLQSESPSTIDPGFDGSPIRRGMSPQPILANLSRLTLSNDLVLDQDQDFSLSFSPAQALSNESQ